MLLSALSVLVVAQPSSEVPERLMNYSVDILPGCGVIVKPLPVGDNVVTHFLSNRQHV